MNNENDCFHSSTASTELIQENHERSDVSSTEPHEDTDQAGASSEECEPFLNQSKDDISIGFKIIESSAKDKPTENYNTAPIYSHDGKYTNGTQEDKTSEEESNVSNDMPELKGCPSFNFKRNITEPFDLTIDDANTAAQICANLIRKLKHIQSQYSYQSVYEDYQIALRRERRQSSNYKLSLRLDALQWYMLERRRNRDIRKQAIDYIERVKCERERDPFFTDEKPPKNSYHGLKELWLCDEEVRFRRYPRRCGFFVKELNCIYMTDKFYAATRANDLPIITVCPKGHCNNEHWVQTPASWQAVFEVLLYIKKELRLNDVPFYEIYANSGRWHSQICSGYSEGHAHMNIVLTSAVIDACKNTSGNLQCLKNSIFRPDDYRQMDAEKLEEKINPKQQSKLVKNRQVW